MTELEFREKSDRDLLVIAVTEINNISRQVEKVCTTVDVHDRSISAIQERCRQRELYSPYPKGKLALGGSLVVVINAVIAWFMGNFKG